MLPVEFKKRMTDLLGDESQAFFEELEGGHAVRSFRVNENKISCSDFEALDPQIDRKRASFPDGSYYTEEEFPGHLPCHHAGMIYMQDPSAMATVHAVKIEKGATILDSCSAPGGKTTQLSAMTGESGIVVANEYEAKRCRILLGNVERMGCRNTVVVNLDTAVIAETYTSKFDVVLCDAPCSGEGMFRKNTLAVEEWSLANVNMCAERQQEILTNVAKCVALGGKLIYSTCTFSLEENEMNVKWFLDTHPDFVLCDVEEELKKVTSDGICFEGCVYDMTKTRRFYPHKARGEGQFIAVLQRCGDLDFETSDRESRRDKKKKSSIQKPSREEIELLASAKTFLDENLKKGFENGVKYELHALNGKAYLKRDVVLPPYGVFASGVCVGEMNGKRFLPHHQLFSAFGTEFLRRVQLTSSDAETEAYLKGMEIVAHGKVASEGKADGWAAVLVDGCAIGGGKISSGVCKNHYPKGLRNQ